MGFWLFLFLLASITMQPSFAVDDNIVFTINNASKASSWFLTKRGSSRLGINDISKAL